jgi:hypothetical protein
MPPTATPSSGFQDFLDAAGKIGNTAAQIYNQVRKVPLPSPVPGLVIPAKALPAVPTSQPAPAPSSAGGLLSNPVVLIGGAAVLLLMMSKRR